MVVFKTLNPVFIYTKAVKIFIKMSLISASTILLYL